eukprot:IDg13624t1
MQALTLQQKKKILAEHQLRLNSGRKPSQEELAQWAKEHLKLAKTPNQGTIHAS